MKRALNYGLLLAILLAVAASFIGLGLDFSGLTSPRSLALMADYAAGFFPADFSSAHLTSIGRASLETLAMSAIGTLLAAQLARLGHAHVVEAHASELGGAQTHAGLRLDAQPRRATLDDERLRLASQVGQHQEQLGVRGQRHQRLFA